MQVTIGTKDENNIVTLSFETVPGRAKDAYSKTIKRLSQNLNIKGFRKGKVPNKMVEEHFGPDQIRAETISNEFLSELLGEAFKEKDLNVVHVPNIENVKFDDPEGSIFIEAKVELFPEVKLADYKKLKLKVQVPKYDLDKEYNAALDNLKLRHANFKESNTPIAMGDEIVFDFDGSYQKPDGSWEPKPGMKAEGYQTIVEPGRFIDNFLEQCVGLKAGDEKEIEVKFPEHYHDDDLAGKSAKFKIKIHKVSKAEKPEVNDDFAKLFGIDTAEELTKRIKEELEDNNKQIRKGIVSEAIVDELHKESKVGLSDAMVSRELENDLATMQYQKNWTDAEVKAYMEKMDRDAEMAKAKNKLEKSVLITTIIKDEDLKNTEEEIRAELSKLQLPPNLDPSKIDYPNLINRINLDLLTAKAIQVLIDNAKIDYEEVDGHVHGPHCGHHHH